MSNPMAQQYELEPLVDVLIDVLYRHLDAHRELAEALEDKERALLKLELETIDEVLERERAVINRIAALETERTEATARIGEAIGHEDPAAMRLSAVVPYVSHELGLSLIEVRDELRTTAARIDKVTQRNRTLVSTSLDHIHLFLSVLSGSAAEPKTYSPQGESKAKARPAVLDRRI
jgi:flagellar biosynthesis/type III secretory pathway chaperone